MNGGRGKRIERGLTPWVHLIVSEASNGWIKRKCVCFVHGCRVSRKRGRETDGKYFYSHLLTIHCAHMDVCTKHMHTQT